MKAQAEAARAQAALQSEEIDSGAHRFSFLLFSLLLEESHYFSSTAANANVEASAAARAELEAALLAGAASEAKMEEAAAALAAKMKQTSREARSRRRELEQALAGEKVKIILFSKINFITIMTSFSTYLPSISFSKK